MKKIAVIIPIYNMEKYLSICLDSIIAQTINNDIEIICINDGSTDSSLSILQDYSSKNENIIIINQNNIGVGLSRNIGISMSNAEYLAFMDPDDFYPSKDVLEKLYTEACRKNVDICGGTAIIFEGGVYITDKNYIFEANKVLLYKDFQGMFGFWRFIYSKKLIEINNLKFSNYRRFQDPPFFIKAMIKAEQFYAVKIPVYCYRRIKKEFNNYADENLIIDILKGFRDVFDLAIENKLSKLFREMILLYNEFRIHIDEHVKVGNKQVIILKEYIEKLITLKIGAL